MNYLQRSFQLQEEKLLMAGLARACRSEHLHVTELPYRFSSWAFDDPANVSLWFAPSGELAAWAVVQTPFWTIDCVVHPAAVSDLHQRVVAWADERAAEVSGSPFGRPCWFWMVFSRQASRISNLEQAGFTCQGDVGEDSWSKVLMRCPGAVPVSVYQPRTKGFIVRPLAGLEEVEAYVDLHRTTFDSKNMTVEWRRRTLQHPAYRPELDLVVEAPDGRLAAFCICWLDGGKGFPLVGHVEPLGCHPDFRQYALGRVALSHGLKRLVELGAGEIYVETDNYRDTAFRLYRSFGFEVIEEVSVFRKDYGPPV